MKKNWFYLFMLMAITVMPLTSCDKEDEPTPNEENLHDPTSDADQTPVTGFDALEWLQSNLAVIDENGNVARRIYGTPLDASQPSVLSVPVDNLEGAKATFLNWIAPGKEATEVEGGYDYNLTDADGNAQGSVSFRAVTDEDNVIARMTIAAGTDLKQVSEVNFINNDVWPENAKVQRYYSGRTYKIKAEDYTWNYIRTPKTRSMPIGGGPSPYDITIRVDAPKRDLEFMCIQGNGNGQEAILVWLCPDEYDIYKAGRIETTRHPLANLYLEQDVYKKLPSVVEAQKVLDFYNANNETWSGFLKEMDYRGHHWSASSGIMSWNYATCNAEFILNSYNASTKKIKCLDLDDPVGKICDVACDSSNDYRYMHIRVFPPATN